MTAATLAIVGASLAGANAAEGARDVGFDGRILLIGDEPHPPYERPPLSKAVLRGEAEPQSCLVHPAGFYSERDIELVADRVVALDVAARRLRMASGDTVAYDSVILATGAQPRRLDVPGADLAGVHYLRTIEDAVRLRDAIGAATRVAVVGAGWIGSEVAASARQTGADVTIVEPAPVPLHRVLGDQIGAVFQRLHADHGVHLRMGVGVRELRGHRGVEEVVLTDGSVTAADVVVVGVGVTPRVELAAAAGLAVGNGIAVDEHLAAGAPGVYAAGDVADAWHPRYRRQLRVEHWANAIDQGRIAGRNAAGRRDSHDRPPYFFSDQYDLGLEYVGHGQPGDSVAVRGDLPGRQFIAFWHREGTVTAAMNVNVWDVVDDLKAIVAAERPVDPARLTDPSVPLTGLVDQHAGA